MMTTTLQVLISTCGADGIARAAAMAIPEVSGVSYLVGWQMPQGDVPPALARRADVRVLPLQSRGLSRNRNALIQAARADVVLFADDDLNYTPEGLAYILKVFSQNPELDFAAIRMTGGDCKTYPPHEFTFSRRLPKGYYLSSVELAVRLSSLPADIRFHHNLGIGNKWYGCGEENFFLIQLITAGLRGRFFPVDVVEHPDLTTGNRTPTAAVLRGHGAYQRLANGIMGLPRLPIDASRRKCNYLRALLHLTTGYLTAWFHFTPTGEQRIKNRE